MRLVSCLLTERQGEINKLKNANFQGKKIIFLYISFFSIPLASKELNILSLPQATQVYN